MISIQMQQLLLYNMVPLVMPDDTYLVSLIHQLGSSLFFGCTIGVLNAMIAMAASVVPWMQRRFAWHDIAVLVLVGCICTFMGFSREMPFVSILFGLVCPIVFFVPWTVICRRVSIAEVSYRRWLIMFLIAVSPFLGLLAFGKASFGTIRDSLLEIPVARSLSNFYYDHTYLAAHVIKPPSAHEQKIIALSRDITRIGPRTHGTLWIRAGDPCAVEGRTVAVSRIPLECPCIVLADEEPANTSNRIMKELGTVYDHNEKMRSGIGLFFYRGPLIFVPVLFILWVTLYVSRLSGRHPAAACLVIIGYLGLFSYPVHAVFLQCQLRGDPQLIHEFLLSEHELKRYLALAAFPEQITDRELARFAEDPSARVRLSAVFESGNRNKPEFLTIFRHALQDDQLNVRTRACLALGNLGGKEALSLLEKVLVEDPSWYVRGYAYRAIGRIRPVTKTVVLAKPG